MELLCIRIQLKLVQSHLFPEFDSFFVVIAYKSDRDTTNDIEQEEVDHSGDENDLKSAITLREKRQDSLNTRVAFLAFLNEGSHVLQDHYFVNAEHDTKTHSDTRTRLLLS